MPLVAYICFAVHRSSPINTPFAFTPWTRLTIADVVTLLDSTPYRVKKWIANGEIPSVTFHGETYVTTEALNGSAPGKAASLRRARVEGENVQEEEEWARKADESLASLVEEIKRKR